VNVVKTFYSKIIFVPTLIEKEIQIT